MKHAIVIMALLALTGCKEEIPGLQVDDRWTNEQRARTAKAEIDRITFEARLDSIKAAANRSELPNTSTANRPELPDSSAVANKVAQVMAANDITLPQVAAYLHAYGFDVINRAEFRRWHWTPPTGGGPVHYYVVNFRVAIGDTALAVYLPQTAGPYSIRVVGYNAAGAGPWSYSNQSAPGALLPGVAWE